MDGRKVLVADDDPFQQQILKTLYAALKVEAVVVANGKLALEAYQQSPNFVHVLMDLHMPVMDGFASAKSIRAHEKAKNLKPIPILGLSGGILYIFFADGDQKTKQACLTAGMNDLLVKPVKKDTLEKNL